MSDDADIVLAMAYCRMARVTVHVRGSDDRIVVECRDKRTRRVVGGIEMRKRFDEAFAREGR